jgi:AraC-like DNA-binding protein/ligand-binding sensor protein
MVAAGVKALVQARLVADFERSFRQSTGLWVRLAPADVEVEPRRGRCAENPFCSLIMTLPQARTVCRKAETALQRSVTNQPTAQQCRCFAGLTVVAVPVRAHGEHVATLLAGQVLRKKPTTTDMARLERQLAAWGVNGQWPMLTRALANTPVVGDQKLEAAVGLLKVFAQLLGEYAASNLLSCCPGEHPSVVKAKEYIATHLDERVAMSTVAQRVGLSPAHFCKTFRESAGMTFTMCLARTRVEKAKALLANPFMRVTEVAFACGFQSISQFNAVFRKQTSQSPTKFRATLTVDYSI